MAKRSKNVWIIKRKHLIMTAVTVFVALAIILTSIPEKSLMVSGQPDQQRVYHMVTGEFKSMTADGKTIEAYRFDPGTIYVKKGEHVQLRIYGVNGDSHPFFIEGTDLSGVIQKGNETVISFAAKKKGIYRIICSTHQDTDHMGPMIGYIIVD